MKRKWLLALFTVTSAIALTAGFAACNEREPDESDGDGSEYENVYGGEGDFVFSKWQAESETVYTEVSEKEDGSTFVRYIKAGSADSMCGIYSEVSGVKNTFRYVNVTVSGIEGRSIMLRIGDSTFSALLLGSDKYVSLGSGQRTFSYEINESNAWMLSTVKAVYLIAEPGQKEAENVGTLTVHKTWFSEALPADSVIAEDSVWRNGGNYKITQNGELTEVSFGGASPNSWKNITAEIADHDPATENTLKFTVSNTGSETVWLSVKTIAADNPDDSSQHTWDNVVLSEGESKELVISLSVKIRSVVIFVSTADNVPAGLHSGSFTISPLRFTLTDPENLCVWQATSKYQLEKGEGKGTFTYTELVNGDWNQNVHASVEHDFTKHNVVSVTIKNTGATAAHYFLKAERNGEEAGGDAFVLSAEQSKTVKLRLSGKITKIVLWVNADSYEGEPGGAAAGSFEMSNPVFSYVEPVTPPPSEYTTLWQGDHAGQYLVAAGETCATVTYEELENDDWGKFVKAEMKHDPTKTNILTFTLTNTGAQAAYYFVKAERDHSEVASSGFELAAGASKDVAITLNSAIDSVVIWVNAGGAAQGSVSPASGSYTVTEPKLIKNNPYRGSAEYATVYDAETDSVSVTYAGVSQNSWKNLTRSLSHDFAYTNRFTMKFENTGSTVVYISIKLKYADGETWGNVTLAEGESKTAEIELTKSVVGTELYICSSDGVPEGMYEGSFVIYEPVFEARYSPVKWTAPDAFTLSAQDGVTTVNYTALPNGSWGSAVGTQLYHSLQHNTLTFVLTNTDEEAAHYFVKTEKDGEEVASSTFDLAAGESKTVVLTLGSQIEAIVIWVNADAQAEGSSDPADGSFTLGEVVFEDR